MVLYDQLRISEDGKRLYLNAHVNKADMFENRYIKTIVIKTASQVSESEADPVSSGGDNIYSYTYDEGVKEVNLVLTPVDFSENFNKSNLSSDLFFVYVICEDTVENECIPCPFAELTTLGVAFDENLLYQKVMDFTKQLAEECTIPQGLIDFILLWNALKASVETEHYVPAIEYYNKLFNNVGSVVTKGCGCHG